MSNVSNPLIIFFDNDEMNMNNDKIIIDKINTIVQSIESTQ